MVRHGHGQRHHGEAEGGERLHKAELHRTAGAEDDESGGGDAYNEQDYTEEAPPSREEAGLAITVPVPEEPTPARLRLSTFGDDKYLNVGLPAHWTLEKFQAEAKKVLEEYFVSRDVGGAVDALRELLADCPGEADELGVLAVKAALDRGDAEQQAAILLLCELSQAALLDDSALVRSFEKLVCAWEDLTIDAPDAPRVLLEMLRGCMERGAVPQGVLMKLPEALVTVATPKVGPETRALLGSMAEELKEFKRRISASLEEYFVSLNRDEVETFLRELNMPQYHHEFVKKTIALSYGYGTDAVRESALTLLNKLSSSQVLSKDDLQCGVTRLLGSLDDLALDCPRAHALTAEFLSWMVADELLSVPFLRRCRLLRIGGASGLQAIDAAERRAPEHWKRYLGPVQFKREIHTIILEYFSSGDREEVARCIRELEPLSPDQSAEIVRKMMVLAMERTGAECELALTALVYLVRNEELEAAAIARGFDNMYERMPDITLDVPDARDMAKSFVVEAKKAGVLDDAWTEPQ